MLCSLSVLDSVSCLSTDGTKLVSSEQARRNVGALRDVMLLYKIDYVRRLWVSVGNRFFTIAYVA